MHEPIMKIETIETCNDLNQTERAIVMDEILRRLKMQVGAMTANNSKKIIFRDIKEESK